MWGTIKWRPTRSMFQYVSSRIPTYSKNARPLLENNGLPVYLEKLLDLYQTGPATPYISPKP